MGHPVQGWSETCPWIFSDVRTLKQCLVRLSTGAARARRWQGMCGVGEARPAKAGAPPSVRQKGGKKAADSSTVEVALLLR